MSSSRASSPKPIKTRKQITSKIDSGVPKRPSTVTFTRQPSEISRRSSQLSQRSRNSSAERNQPVSASSNQARSRRSYIRAAPQPINYSASASVSDHVKVHKLGQIPAYLRRDRPKTGPVKAGEFDLTKQVFRLDDLKPIKTSNEGLELVATEIASSSAEKPMRQTQQETDQIEPARECPPCEGSTQEALLVAKQHELAELLEKFKQLEEKCERREAELRMLRAQESSVRDKEPEVVALREQLKNLRKELCAKELEVATHREHVKSMQRELQAKDTTISEKDRKIANLMTTIEKKERFNEELTEKLTLADSTLEALRYESKSLERRVRDLTSEMEIRRQQKQVISQEAKIFERSVVEASVEDRQFEQTMAGYLGKQEHLLMRIRSFVEKTEENFKREIRERCAGIFDDEIKTEDKQRDKIFELDELFDFLDEETEVVCEEEKISSRKSIRNELLEIVEQLKVEGRAMREFAKANCGSEARDQQNHTLNENKDDRIEKDQITSRILYDDQLEDETPPEGMENF